MNFNDNEYEGINLKIPYWFYSINKDELKPILDNLQDFFQNKAKSHFHPDNQRNIFELESIDSKKEIVSERYAEDKKRKIEREQYEIDLLAGNIYELCWIRKTADSNIENGVCLVTKDGTNYNFSLEETVTKKYNLSKKVSDKYREIKKDLDIRETVNASKLFRITGNMDYYKQYNISCPESNIKIENLSSDVWNLRLTYSYKAVKVYQKNSRNGKVYYSESQLYYSDDRKCPCFLKGKEFVYLENYSESNYKFKKIKS